MEIARGHVSDRPFARAFYMIAAKRFTGDFVLTQTGRSYKVSWEGGRITAADSASPSDQPLRVALAAGLITSSVVTQVVQTQSQDRTADQLELITRLGRLSGEQIAWLKRRSLAMRAARQFSLGEASYTLNNARSLVADPDVPSIDARWLIYFGVVTHYPVERLEAEAAPILDKTLQISADAVSGLPAFGFGEVDAPCVQRLRQRAWTVGDLAAATPEIERHKMLAILYTLVACDCLEVTEGPGRAALAQGTVLPQSRITGAIPTMPAPATGSAPIRSRTATGSREMAAARPASGGQPAERGGPPTAPPGKPIERPPPPTAPTSPPGKPIERPRPPTVPATAPQRPRTVTPTATPPRPRTATGDLPARPRTATGDLPVDDLDEPGTSSSSASRSTASRSSLRQSASGRRATHSIPVSTGARGNAPITANEVRILIRSKIKELDQGADFFALLGVSREALDRDIQAAYFNLARRLHPDRLRAVGALELEEAAQRLFARINQAFATLTNPKKLTEYRELLAGGGEKAMRQRQADAELMAARIFEAEEYFRAGEMALRRNAFAAAAEAFHKAVELNPEEGEHHAFLAWALWCAAFDKNGVAIKVNDLLTEAIKKSPNSVAVWLYRGLVSKQRGDTKAAKAAFKRVLEIDDNHNQAQAELRLITTKEGDDSKGGGLFGRKRR